jgi:Tfp pilus assembly protein FimT
LKRTSTNREPRRRGVSLIECLVYLSLLSVIGGVAMLSLGRLWTATGRLGQNGDDLLAALRAGEQWRDDVRAAQGPVESLPDSVGCRIRGAEGTVEWRIDAGRMIRRVGERETVWLERVRESAMTAEARTRVQCWRWEVTLASRSTRVRMEPRFSFVTVPGGIGQEP